MNYEDIIEPFGKLSTKEQAEVLSILSKTLYKGLGGKKSKLATSEKKPASAAFLSWNEEVSEAHADLKKTNPKATRADAMAEAAKRRDSTLSPEEALKRAEERDKRKVKKEEKKASSPKSSKSSSKIASAFASDTESEEDPKAKAKAEKLLKKEVEKKQKEIFGSDSEEEKPKPKKAKKVKEESKDEEVKEEPKEEPKVEEEPKIEEEPKEEPKEAKKVKESFKLAKIKGKKFIYNPENGAAYEAIDGEDGKPTKGDYVGKFSKSPIPKIDDSVAEEDCTA